MIMYRYIATSLFAAGLLTGSDLFADDAIDGIDASATMPRVEISPRSSGRRPLTLPSLSYDFELDTHCAGGEAQSLMLSVADSRRRLDQEGLQQPDSISLTMAVPAKQIAPLQVEEFCTDESTGEGMLVIKDVLSAQMSLVCVVSDGETTAESTSHIMQNFIIETG